jgi:hypothetical protein
MMESELDQINQEIEDLEHQAAAATGQAKRDLEEALEALKEKREQIDLKLQPDLYSDAERNLALRAEEAKTELRGDL